MKFHLFEDIFDIVLFYFSLYFWDICEYWVLSVAKPGELNADICVMRHHLMIFVTRGSQIFFRYLLKQKWREYYSGAKPGELHADVEEDSREAGVKCEQIIIIIIINLVIMIIKIIIVIIIIVIIIIMIIMIITIMVISSKSPITPSSKVSASSRILTANMLRVTSDKRMRVMHEKGGEVILVINTIVIIIKMNR